MDASIYSPLFLVLTPDLKKKAIYYLPADFQMPSMFIPRKPLSAKARREGWQGFIYDLSTVTLLKVDQEGVSHGKRK